MGYFDLHPGLTPEHLQLKEQAHKFAAQIMRPAARELDSLSDPADVISRDSVLWGVYRMSRLRVVRGRDPPR